PCSEVAFFGLPENWVATQQTNNQIPVTLSGYNRFDSNLERIVVEYLVMDNTPPGIIINSPQTASSEENEEMAHLDFSKIDVREYNRTTHRQLESLMASQRGLTSANRTKSGGSSETQSVYLPIMEVPRDSLVSDMYSVIWNIDGIADGEYVLRARAECSTGLSSSTGFYNGIIDRRGPTLMPAVSPEPADGVLHLGDQISFTFNENIIPLQSYNDSIRVTNLSRNEAVAKSWFVEENKLYIGLEVDNRFIERDRIEIELRGITDERGNAQNEPITFSFIVNRNQVEWESGNAEIALYPEVSNQFTFVLENNHLEEMSYELSSLPSWLRVFPESGSIPAAGTRTITFEVDSSLNFGLYRTTINAETLNGVAPLVLELRVMAEPPRWTATQQEYQYSMSIIGQVFIGSDTPSADPYDMVGAFIGDEPRGRALVRSYPSVSDSTRHLVMLTVFSNEPSGQTVDLRVWDAVNGVEYANTTRQYSFQANTVVGTLASPVDIRTTRDIFYRKEIPAGWSWLSYNVLRDNDFIGDYVGRFVRSAEGDIIKNMSEFLVYTEGIGWAGTLTGIDITSGYMLNMTYPNLIETYGAPVNPSEHPIKIEAGWNFIGYTPDKNYTVNYGLSDRSFRDGDFIKGQNSFAFYSEAIGWVGSLTFLKPTEAYMLRVAEAGDFVYPSVDEVLLKTPLIEPNPDLPELSEEMLANLGEELNPSDFEFNMTVTAQIAYGDSLQSAEHYVLAAMVDDELRGIATPTLVGDDYYFFLMVYDNTFEGSEITFRFMDIRTNEVYDLNGTMIFRADRVVGNLREPHTLSEPVVANSIGNDGELPREFSLGNVYPNPFNPTAIIPYSIAEESAVNIVLYDITGRQVAQLVREVQSPGRYEVMLRGVGLSSGVYIIRMSAGGHLFTKKVTLIK
ncbi:MAG: T9SS type A sorting domain-containing protein, partial [Balneolales bacterium]|nr:T9SS type A sorting domain-containing protein [Balneolales bacterium]